MSKFPNLDAEQARHGHNDVAAAALCGIKYTTFLYKKRKGGFTAAECMTLCQIYSATFEYLFQLNGAARPSVLQKDSAGA